MYVAYSTCGNMVSRLPIGGTPNFRRLEDDWYDDDFVGEEEEDEEEEDEE